MGDGKGTPALEATLPVGATAVAFQPDALVGTWLRHFEITGLLGRGGMGAVYLAQDSSLDRRVALKVLAPEVGVDDEIVARFVREARAQARLSHPNVTQIYFIGEDRDLHFFAMEFVDGTPLNKRVETGEKVPWPEAIEIARQAAEGLRAASQAGFVHRDVKPSNLLVDANGRVKIADFGLVKSLRGDAELTRAGMIVGSPLYMAPEQGRAEEVDHRSDIYSLGCTLYHLLTRQPPFNSLSPVAVMSMHVTDRATRIRAIAADTPETVERLVDRMMAKQPDHRFSSYDELIEALEALRPGAREHSAFWKRATAMAIDLSIFGGLSLLIGGWAFLLASIYFIAAHKFGGQTLGKLLLGLQVVDAQGHAPSWKASLVRFGAFAWGPIAWGALGALVFLLHRNEKISFTLGRMSARELWRPLLYASLAGAIFLVYLAGLLLAVFHPRRRALHDLAAKTEVVQKPGRS